MRGRAGLEFPRFNQAGPAMKAYESEITQFIREFLQKHPDVVEKQKKARATWWDRPQNLAERKVLDEARSPKKAYEYYNLDKET